MHTVVYNNTVATVSSKFWIIYLEMIVMTVKHANITDSMRTEIVDLGTIGNGKKIHPLLKYLNTRHNNDISSSNITFVCS